MENILLSPSKHTKEQYSSEFALDKLEMAKRIPKNLYLKMTSDDKNRRVSHKLEILKRRYYKNEPTRMVTYDLEKISEAEREAKIVVLYHLKRVHKWDFHKELDLGYDIVDGSLSARNGEPMIKNLRYYSNANRNRAIQPARLFDSLKKLNLCFYPHYSLASRALTDKHRERLITEISHNLQLECLELSPNSKEVAIFAIQEIARRLIQLKKFKYNNSRTDDDEVITLFGHKIGRYLVNLQSLELYFSDYALLITDKGIKSLGLTLGKNLSNLEHLKIRLTDFNFSDKALKIFIGGICGDLKHLHKLELEIIDYKSINGSGLKIISTEICKHLKELRNLSLNFEKCESVFPDDIRALRSKIKKELPELKSFKLNKTLIE